MVYQEDFGVERWMDEYETYATVNIGETCAYSLSLEDVSRIIDEPIPIKQLTSKRIVYGDISGSPALRSTIASMYNDTSDGKLQIKTEDVLITNGAIGANFLLYYSLVGPGDHVIVVDPSYQQLSSVPAMFGASVDLLKLTPEDSYLPNLDVLRSLVKKGQTKLIVVNSPHNPYGSVIYDDLMQEIVEIARDIGAYLLCDEVYRPLYHSIPDGKSIPSSVVTLYEKGISTGSSSKAFGLAGLRTGWIVATDPQIIKECLKRRDYNTISVSVIDDFLANWALQGWKKLVEYNSELCRKNLKILDEFVKASNGAVSFFKPEGGTTILLRIAGCKDTEKFSAEFITKFKTMIVPGECFNDPGTIRIGYGNSTEEMIEGLENLKQFIIPLRLTSSPWST